MAYPKSLLQLNGIVPPMVTPLADYDSLDITGLEKLIEHIIAGGVNGLFILGTTGEAAALGYQLRRELIERTCQQVNSRIPVLVGITDTSYTESVRLAEHAAQKGAQALVIAPPYYYTASQDELLGYFEQLAKELPLPLFLYNMPGCTKMKIERETVRQAANIPGIIGLKDSSADMMYLQKLRQMMANRPDFPLFIGPEELLAEFILMGGNGGISAGANLFPELYVNLYNAAKAGDAAATRELQKKVIQISNNIYGATQHGSSCIKGLKYALCISGICSDQLAKPFHQLSQSEQKIIEHFLAEMPVVVAKRS